MRRCFIACWLIVALSLDGCAWLGSLYEKGPDGAPSTMETIAAVIGDFPYGKALGGLLLAGRWFVAEHGNHQHKKTKKAKEPKLPPTAPA